MVLKFYQVGEVTAFQEEVEANLALQQVTLSLKMSDFEDFSSDKQPLYLGGYTHYHYAYILMPYLPKGTVLQMLMNANSRGRTLSLACIKYIFRSLLLSLIELRDVAGLSNCDIKVDNMMLDENLKPILIDFGHASEYNTMISRITGTGIYWAPEIRDGR